MDQRCCATILHVPPVLGLMRGVSIPRMQLSGLCFPGESWSVDELAAELRLSQIDGVLDLLRAVNVLSDEERATCGERLLMLRITKSRVRATRALLGEAEDDLARRLRRVWLACAEAELVATASRLACDRAQQEVERLEDELRALATERQGLEAEVLDLLGRAHATLSRASRRA